MPGPAQDAGVPADEHGLGAPARMCWARLLKRVFDLDLEHCPQCGGNMKIIAAIEEPAVIVKILTHLGLPARAPPRSPARPLALFQAACDSTQERPAHRVADLPAPSTLARGAQRATKLLCAARRAEQQTSGSGEVLTRHHASHRLLA